MTDFRARRPAYRDQVPRGWDFSYWSDGLDIVNGTYRVRACGASYLDAPAYDPNIVLRELPRYRYFLRGDEEEGEITEARVPDEFVSSSSTPRKRTAAGHTATQRRNKRGRFEAGDRYDGDNELARTLQDTFDNIRVYACGARLGAFTTDLEFAPADPAVAEFLATPAGRVPGLNPDQCCFMLRCGAVQMAHLKRYDGDDMRGPNFAEFDDPVRAERALIDAIDWVQDRLTPDVLLPELLDLSTEDNTIDLKKSPGVYYKLKGFKTRGDANDLALAEANAALATLMTGRFVPPRPTRLGGRGKLVDMSEQAARDTDTRKGRAIHMTDSRDHHILNITERLLNNLWKSPHYPISVGRGWLHGDATNFVNKFGHHQRFFCFDAEKFDASLHAWFIHVALQIMRGMFSNGHDRAYDAYWDFVERSLLGSLVYRDDGIVFQKWHGTSSGHNHNSLAQSICTLIMMAFTVYHANPSVDRTALRRMFDGEALGDDNFLAEMGVLNPMSVEDRAGLVWNVFQVSWYGTKSFETNALLEARVSDATWAEEAMYGSAQYLGKYFRRVDVQATADEVRGIAVPHRPLKEVVLRLLYPERVERPGDGDDAVDIHQDNRGGRVLGMVIDGFGNPWVRDWLRDFFNFCGEEGYTCDLGVPKRLIARWKRQGVDWNLSEISEVRFDAAQWLKLIVFVKGGAPLYLNPELDRVL